MLHLAYNTIGYEFKTCTKTEANPQAYAKKRMTSLWSLTHTYTHTRIQTHTHTYAHAHIKTFCTYYTKITAKQESKPPENNCTKQDLHKCIAFKKKFFYFFKHKIQKSGGGGD